MTKPKKDGMFAMSHGQIKRLLGKNPFDRTNVLLELVNNDPAALYKGMYKKTKLLMHKYNPCGISNGMCNCGRAYERGDTYRSTSPIGFEEQKVQFDNKDAANFCCDDCEHLQENGECGTESLFCALALCNHAKPHSDIALVLKIMEYIGSILDFTSYQRSTLPTNYELPDIETISLKAKLMRDMINI